MKALSHAYVGRKLKKRDFRKLWIQRINAGTRANGMSYSKFMYGLKKAGITINRKMLSEMAIHDPEGFSALVETAKAKNKSLFLQSVGEIRTFCMENKKYMCSRTCCCNDG